MSLSAAIVPHLPYLRRFARALTGNQASGDAYAVATLEAIAEDDRGLEGHAGTRQHLFKCFLTIWRSIPANRLHHDEFDNGVTLAADRTLESLTPLPRVAFLLRTVEGFSTQEIAAMLESTPETVRELLDTAGRQIASQLRTEVLIIEDEQVIAMDLEALVEDLGHTVLPIAHA
jgi:DNA-directed RNA polymerase specialized sigma24 family protein